MLTSADKVGGSKKGQKHADVILEWSLVKKRQRGEGSKIANFETT
jgi:hypothetical protein